MTRRGRCAAAALGVGLLLGGGPVGRASAGVAQPASPAPETVVEIRVHGNQGLSDEEVLALVGLAAGDPFGPDTVADVERRLLDSGRFESVEVRKRYVSLTALDRVALIVVVDERPAAVGSNPVSRAFGEVGRSMMFLPIFDYTEGYGVTVGARTSFVDVLGANGRLSVPATFGGTTGVALEADTVFETGPVSRLRGGVGLRSREHPHFEIDDDRTRVWARVDRRLPARLNLTAGVEWAEVRFGGLDDRLTRVDVGLEIDTRNDPFFPRDAVFASARYEWLDVRGRTNVIGRPAARAEGYLGLVGQSVLAVRAGYDGATAALPDYEQSLLGGGRTLRGWRVGELIGDRRTYGSAELRMPLSSPLSIARMGVALFYDTGTVFDVDEALSDARFHQGAGLGVFMRVPILTMRLDVAHDLVESVRVHFAAVVAF